MRVLNATFTAITIAGFLVTPLANASIIPTFFPASTYNASTSIMDAALGITGYTIDDFESTALIPGLSITLTGGVPATTWTSLPNLDNASICGSLGIAAWDGAHAATNSITNLLNSCSNPSGLANLTTFNYAPGTTSFGISLTNFQSVNPPSPQFPVTNHELFVNGVDMGVLEALAGANWSPGIVRNAYLRIDATGSSTITSVGFENLAATDFLAFDRLAVQGSAAPGVPEPGTIGLLVVGLAAILVRRRK